jgi:hypothetical protein
LRRLLEKVGTLSVCQPLVKPGILLHHPGVPEQQPTWEIAIDKSTKGVGESWRQSHRLLFDDRDGN